MAKLIDVVFDLETTALVATAAPMQLAACAFDREHLGEFLPERLNEGFDLRSAFIEGCFTFDDNTAQWWSKRSEGVKDKLCSLEGIEVSCIVSRLALYVTNVMKAHNADCICLWCQGSDFDIPILRQVAHHFEQLQGQKNEKKWPWKHYQFRDARTFVLEGGCQYFELTPADVALDPYQVYRRIAQYTAPADITHDADFDCHKTAWGVMDVMSLNATSHSIGNGTFVLF